MLSHLQVLDLTQHLGAFAGRMLAELGAQVIKVEPESGDPQRQHPEQFVAFNHGKRSVVVAPGSDEFNRLLQHADIVLRNPGLNHEELISQNPKLIDVVIGAFLPGGKNQNRPATDLTLMARSGLMTIIGDPDRPPLTLPGEQAYALGAIQAVTGALTALHARAITGRGQRVDVSALQAAVLANYREPLTWGWTGRVGNRTGNLLVRGQSGVRQVWPCADGFVTWALVDNPPMMRAMVKVMGTAAGDLADVDWDNILVADVPRATLEHWEYNVAEFFLQHNRDHLGQLSSQLGLGLSWIDTPDDVLVSEHEAARNLWVEVGETKLPGPLWVSSAKAPEVNREVPVLGEGNTQFLGVKP